MDTPERTHEVPLSPLAELVIAAFEKKDTPNHEQKISVNPVVAKFATWYEKFRNAMEYREDEVILRAAIERILRRRLLLGGTGKTAAEPLVREIIWARYLPDNHVPESVVERVEEIIDLHLSLRLKILEHHRMPQMVVDEWTYHLMSSEIENMMHPNIAKDTLANFMFQVLKDHVRISDDTEETRNAQVYMAVRKAFARDDTAFLRYHLFQLFFGQVTAESVERIAKEFPEGYAEIERELHYPRRERIYAYIKKRAASFLILEDILSEHKNDLRVFLSNAEQVEKEVLEDCDERYKSISSKVKRAIVRSVLFILLTKAVFAFGIEGTYERIFYGGIQWSSLLLNMTIPPLLMIIVSLFIRTPDKENSRRILSAIKEVLYSENPRLGQPLVVKKAKDARKPILHGIFTLLWFLAFALSFGGIMSVLTLLHFNPVSQGIFIFFLAIVSFLSYRISLVANLYRVGEKQGLLTPVVDFLFMPVVRVGQRLTQSISQINFLLFIFDFIIETPFKIIFGFFEQWFRFLHDKREEIG
ncbi:MAG: hypothetical protein RLZZ455_839 [Candidatus Parcubacteria bacterium]|jgi:hypothetical protein